MNNLLDNFIKHSRNRSYMAGVDRNNLRVKQTGEVFTPTELVQEILNKIPIDRFKDHNKTFLDPTCGDGPFLSEVMIKKMENGATQQQALDTVFGADLMEDNCIECIRRLFGEGEIKVIKKENNAFPKEYFEKGIIAVFTHNGQLVKNIVQADGLEYAYNFGRPTQIPDNMKLFCRLKKPKIL